MIAGRPDHGSQANAIRSGPGDSPTSFDQGHSGGAALVHLAPDREPVVFHGPSFAANRQGATEWHEHAVMSETVAREARLAGVLAEASPTREGLERVFLEEPVHRPPSRHIWGTVYTASYDVARRVLRLLWPDGERWEVRLDDPREEILVRETVFTPPLLERTREIPHVPQVIFA